MIRSAVGRGVGARHRQPCALVMNNLAVNCMGWLFLVLPKPLFCSQVRTDGFQQKSLCVSSHNGAGLTRFVCLYLIPWYCIFLLNTSSYSCFVAVCHLLFFPVGIACLIFTFLLLYYMTSLLYLCLCRRSGTNCGQTMPKKWIIHCIHSFVSFFGFFFPLPRLSALSLKTMSNLVA